MTDTRCTIYVSDAAKCSSSTQLHDFRAGYLCATGGLTGNREHAAFFWDADAAKAHIRERGWLEHSGVILGRVTAYLAPL